MNTAGGPSLRALAMGAGVTGRSSRSNSLRGTSPGASGGGGGGYQPRSQSRRPNTMSSSNGNTNNTYSDNTNNNGNFHTTTATNNAYPNAIDPQHEQQLKETLAELEEELERKRVEVITIKATINERLEAQRALEESLSSRIREALEEAKAREEEARREATDANAVRLVQINLEMDAMREKVDALAAREQLGAAGLVRMSATLTDLEKAAGVKYNKELKPLAAMAQEMLKQSRANTKRLVPILGEEAASAALARAELEGLAEDTAAAAHNTAAATSSSNAADSSNNNGGIYSVSRSMRASKGGSAENNEDGDDDEEEQSATALPMPYTQQFKAAGSPMEFTPFQRESCASSVALVEAAEATKGSLVALVKEIGLESALLAALYSREAERQQQLKEEAAAQESALGAAQVVAKDLADGLIISEDRLTRIHERIDQLTREINGESGDDGGSDPVAALQAKIEDTKGRLASLTASNDSLEAENKAITARNATASAQLKALFAENAAAAEEVAHTERQIEEVTRSIDALAKERAASAAARRAVEDKVNSLELAKARAERSVADALAALEAAREKRKDKEAELADVKSELKIAKNAAEGTREKALVPLVEKTEETEAEIDALNREATELKNKTLEQGIKADEAQRKVEQLREENAGKEREIEYLRKLLAQRGGGGGARVAGAYASASAASAPHSGAGTPSMAAAEGAPHSSSNNNKLTNAPTEVYRTTSTASAASAGPGRRRTASSAAEAYLSTLGASPELVRASTSRSASTADIDLSMVPPAHRGAAADASAYHYQHHQQHGNGGYSSTLSPTPFGAADRMGGYADPYATTAAAAGPSPSPAGQHTSGEQPYRQHQQPHQPQPQAQPQPQQQRRDLTAEYQYQAAMEARGYGHEEQPQQYGGHGGQPLPSALASVRQRGDGAAVNGGYGGAADVASSAAVTGGGSGPAPSISNINSRLAAILERKNRRGQTGAFY